MGNFSLSPEAREDLDQIHTYIAESNPEAADRVLNAAFATFAALAGRSQMGQRRSFKNSELSEVRSFRIRGFRNYLIFYRPGAGSVGIVRVLHAARDLDALFGTD